MQEQFRGGQKSCQNNLGRDSNIELLRLVCMLFILLHHSLDLGLCISGYQGMATPMGVVLNSFFIVAVNCFVLISGYFGIKTKCKGLIHLYIMCAFYSVIPTLFSFYEAGQFVWRDFFYSFLVFSHSKWWFIECYILLFFFAPMLNAIKSVSKRRYIIILLLWSVITFYFGYLWKSSLNSTGYNTINFMFLYLIGQFIALYMPNLKMYRIKLILLYIINSLIIAGIGIVILKVKIDLEWISLLSVPYNSPFVVLGAVLLFMIFRTFSFQSKSINWLASSALAIYLLHCNAVVREYLWPFIAHLQEIVNNGWLLSLYLVFLALTIMMACILIDKLRMFITNPVERLVLKINWDEYARTI